MAALVWLYCYIHCGPSWLDPLFAHFFFFSFFKIRGALLHLPPSWVNTGTRGVKQCVCVCVWCVRTDQEKSRVGSHVPDPRTPSQLFRPAPIIRRPRPCACLLFKQRLLRQNLPTLWKRDKERAKKGKESTTLAKMWFPVAEEGQELHPGPLMPAESRAFLNQHAGTSRSSARSFQDHHSFHLFRSWKTTSCLFNSMGGTYQNPELNQIQSLALWLMILSDKYNVK